MPEKYLEWNVDTVQADEELFALSKKLVVTSSDPETDYFGQPAIIVRGVIDIKNPRAEGDHL